MSNMLHEALLKVRRNYNRGTIPVWDATGLPQPICNQVYEYLDGADYDGKHRYRLAVLVTQWPEYSGNSMFPVPGPYGSDPVQALRKLDRWSGIYGMSRLRLLDWLIEQTKE